MTLSRARAHFCFCPLRSTSTFNNDDDSYRTTLSFLLRLYLPSSSHICFDFDHYMLALCTFGCLWCSAVFWPSFYDVLNIIIFITLIFPIFISSHRKAVATTASEAVASRKKIKYLNKILSPFICWHCFDFGCSPCISHSTVHSRLASKHWSRQSLNENTSLALRIFQINSAIIRFRIIHDDITTYMKM